MIFGDRNIFAIDADLTQEGLYACINYCFWIRNQLVGDKTITSLLTTELDFISNVIDKKGKRYCNIERVSTVTLTDYLINNIWNPEDTFTTIDNVYIAKDILNNLDIGSNASESFTQFYLFVIECNGYDWFLLKDGNANKYIDIKIPKNNFYQVFEHLKKWIDDSTSLALNSYINRR